MSVSSLSSVAHDEVMRALKNHALPEQFYSTVIEYYLPVARAIAKAWQGGLCIVGIQGSQGSGKSTCADFLKLLFDYEFGRHAVAMSIDDFYLTHAERKALALTAHPLFMTRGVPGTHDIELLKSVFDKARAGQPFDVPVFDKSLDDRSPPDVWQQVRQPVDILIFEGWCVGVTAELEANLEQPKNALEHDEDPDQRWRARVNQALASDYAQVFSQLDTLISLQAPSFDCVFDWRLLQEQKMIDRLKKAEKDISKALTPAQLKRFIAHYQRLTEHALDTMPTQADYVLHLSADHSFNALQVN